MEIQKWVLEKFNRKINSETVRSRIYRVKKSVETQQSEKSDTSINNNSTIAENQKIKRGGKRQGAGRPLKYKVVKEKDPHVSRAATEVEDRHLLDRDLSLVDFPKDQFRVVIAIVVEKIGEDGVGFGSGVLLPDQLTIFFHCWPSS